MCLSRSLRSRGEVLNNTWALCRRRRPEATRRFSLPSCGAQLPQVSVYPKTSHCHHCEVRLCHSHLLLPWDEEMASLCSHRLLPDRVWIGAYDRCDMLICAGGQQGDPMGEAALRGGGVSGGADWRKGTVHTGTIEPVTRREQTGANSVASSTS